MPPMADLPFALLQLTDSACPTGGFAHSSGVEELVRSGQVRDADDLLAALTCFVDESLAGRELAFVGHAWDAARDGDLGRVQLLVRERIATRLTRTAREAESQRGQALMRVVRAVMSAGPADGGAVRSGPLVTAAAGSYAILFGVGGFLCGAERRTTVRAAAFSQMAATAQAAVRLGRVGPTGAQHVLGRLAGPLERAVAESEERAHGEWHGFAPGWELAQSRHEHRPSGMFLT